MICRNKNIFKQKGKYIDDQREKEREKERKKEE